MRWPGGTRSLTLLGKAAPPRPTMPAQRMRSRRASGSGLGPRGGGSSAQASRPSVSMRMQGALSPEAWGTGRSSIATTVPELGAWTVALMDPWASPINWPLPTRSPTPTSGLAGAPICCWRGMTSKGDRGAVARGAALDRAFSSGRCRPPWKVHSGRGAGRGEDASGGEAKRGLPRIRRRPGRTRRRGQQGFGGRRERAPRPERATSSSWCPSGSESCGYTPPGRA